MIVLADDAKVPIGFVQVIDPALEESHYWGTHCPPNLRAIDIWIGEETYLSKGYGTQIMKLILDKYCFCHENLDAVLMDPLSTNTKVHRFYQRLGFQPIGVRQFGSDECLVHRLEREEWMKKRQTL